MANDPRQTPAMQQYYRFKRMHPGCVLLFRIGDFYEMFDEDAVAVSKAIGLTLTQRTAGVPMAGVPHHQLETYLKKLIGAGFRVAVGEQLVDASQVAGTKAIVPRAVTRVLTPGTLVDESLLEGENRQTLAAVSFVAPGDDSPAELAIVEVSTGEFVFASVSAAGLADELFRRGVREVLFADAGDGKVPARLKRVVDHMGIATTPRAPWQFRPGEGHDALKEHFRVGTLAGFGLRDDDPACGSGGAIVRYLRETQTLDEETKAELEKVAGTGGSARRATLAHLRPPKRETPGSFCVVDAVSLRALEVERTLRSSAGGGGAWSGREADGSLLGIFLGATSIGAGRGKPFVRTPMGKRLLRDWLCRPLREREGIVARQNAVSVLIEDRRLAGELAGRLDLVQDVPRLAGRLALGRLSPRDLVALASSLTLADDVATLCEGVAALAGVHRELAENAAKVRTVAAEVLRVCVENAPAHLREGGFIRDGVDAALDEARLLQRDAGQWLAAYQARLIDQHNLPSLKVGFNKVFGYYIELPQGQAKQAPAELQRKQTLKNAERYTTPELREFEGKVTTAEARAFDREREIFAGLCDAAMRELHQITRCGDALAELDALLAFAEKSHKRGWKRPEIVDEPCLTIHAGRHPVLDEVLEGRFVPNDVELGGAPGSARASLALITGPNMAGKSTYIRQVALITLLAHTGCFVPADRATIGVVDRIFTRIGADDALHAGQSTFMVEMIETANILNHASPRSLVVLDEIGRGTSTLDGLSLAWAITEHLAGGEGQAGPRTLFATHYHELTDLEERLPGRVVNLHVAVREWPADEAKGGHPEIVFLHRIEPGRADQSYGVHVARLAGIPLGVVDRAREVLSSLAVHHVGTTRDGADSNAPSQRGQARPTTPPDGQFSLFTEYVAHPAVEQLREIKLESLSPMQAFDELRRLRGLLDKARS